MKKIFFALFLFVYQFGFTQTYTAIPSTYNTNGGGNWGAILKIKCTPYSNGTGVFTVRKTDGTSFSSSGTLYLKVGGHDSYNVTRTSVHVNAGDYTLAMNTDFTAYTGYPKEFYARFESDGGGYAWAGPITIYGPPSIQVNSLNTGYQVGETMHISWNSTNQHHWEIDILHNGTQVGKILSSNSNRLRTYYDWQIPTSTTDNNGVTHTLNGSNYKIKVVIWNTGDGNNEQHVYDTSNSFSITPQATNSPPYNPTIYSYSGTIYVNQSVDIRVRSGSDPDGDNTKIHVTGQDSNLTDTNPYISSFNSSATTYSVPITFNQTGTKTVYAVTYDEHGAASSVVTKTFNVVQQSSNNSPNDPTIYDYTGTIFVNQSINISVRSGSDPDGDNTKIHVTGQDSNLTDSNPYISSFNSSPTTYPVPITFNQTGIKTVYAVTYDEHGAASNVKTRTFNVVQQTSNNPPGNASFINAPSQLNLNESFNFYIQSGTDPDGDMTKIKVWATGTNMSPNPFVSTLQAGGHQFSVPISFNQAGNQTVTIQTIDANGASSGTQQTTINVIDNNNIADVTVGNIHFTADNITQNGSIYTLSGNVQADNIIHFDGVVTVNTSVSNLSVSGNGAVYLTNIPNLNRVDLYNGSFEYAVNGDTLQRALLNEANELFTMAGLDVRIDDIIVNSGSIIINGELKLPPAFGVVNAEINQVNISQANGLQFAGSIVLDDLPITQSSEYKVNGELNFDTINDEFSGNVNLETPTFSVEAGLSLRDGKLDSISIGYYTLPGIPLGSTGLMMTGLHGSLEHIQPPHPPNTSVTLGMSLAPVGGSSVIQLRNVELTYVFNESFSGNGEFTVLNTQIANAGFTVRENLFEVNANVNFYDAVIGNASIKLAKANNLDEVLTYGDFNSVLKIPNRNDLLYRAFRSLGYQLPLFLADTHNRFTGSSISGVTLSGHTTLNYQGFPFQISYSMTPDNNYVPYFLCNWDDLQNYLNSNQTRQLRFQSPPNRRLRGRSLYNRSLDGRSLIVDSREYTINRAPNSPLSIDFLLPGVTKNLLITVKPDTPNGNIPSYRLIDPNGNEINTGNISNNSDVIYSEYQPTKEAFYAINNAQSGAWQILIDNPNQTYLVDLDGVEEKAGIAITNVVKNNNNVTVSWLDHNDTFDGQISLFYDIDNQGFDGNIIATGISEDDSTNSYTFDVSSLPAGQYYVYAIMYDEVGNAVTSYSQDFFTIGAQIPAPTNFNYTVNNDNSVTFTWDTITGDYDYLIYYEANGDVNYNSPNVNTGNTNTFTVTNFDPSNSYYTAMVVAKDRNTGVKGNASNMVNIELSKTLTFDLHAGWNLIGFSIQPTQQNMRDFFAPISSSMVQINSQSEVFNPALPDYLNTLNNIDPIQGYFINMSQATQFTYTGHLYDTNQISYQLHTGWNLISYPGITPADIAPALNSISSYIIQVNSQTEVYNPAVPDYLNTLHQLEPNKGYWIKVSQDCILTF